MSELICASRQSLANHCAGSNTEMKKILDETESQLDSCSALMAENSGPISSPTAISRVTRVSSPSSTVAKSLEPSATCPTAFMPTSNCLSLGSTYTSAQTGSLLDVHCGTNYPFSDMLGVYVFQFTDCMEACASWNKFRETTSPQCLAIVFDNEPYANSESSGMGNCWLKNSGNTTARASTADGASLRT